MKLTTPKQAASERGITTLLMGKTGAGKTTFIGSAQDSVEDAPLLIIDVENGLQSLRDRDDIAVATIESKADMEEALESLSGALEYRTVAIDSITAYADMQLAHYAGDSKPDWDDHANANADVLEVIDKLSKLAKRGINTLMTVRVVDEVVKNPDGSSQVVQIPYIRPQVSKQIYAAVDIVGLIKVGFQNKRVVELTPSPDFTNLKARTPIPVSKLTQVDFGSLIALVKNSEKSGEKVQKPLDKPPPFSKMGSINQNKSAKED